MKLSFNVAPSLFLFLFYAVIAAALLSPLSSMQQIPAITDYVNHIAYVIEAKMALLEGQFPLRVAPMELSGWRYPSYQFYGSSVYTLAGFIYQWITPSNPVTAIKLTIGLALIIGGLFMRRLAYWFVKSEPAALLASVVYLTAPYYIIVINGIGNVCETVALGIMPAVIYYSLERYLHPKENKTLLQAGLAWYLLITTHMITFVYTALFLATLLLCITCKNKRHWKNLIATATGCALGCLLAMWFLAPIALLQQYLVIAQTFLNLAQFQSFSPSISNLLFPGHLSFQGPLGGNHVAIGWPIVIAVGLCVYACFNNGRLPNARANYWLLPLLLLFFLAFMLIWAPIHFLEWVPSALLIGQYCWRLLDQLIWIGALLFAWGLCWLFKNKMDLRHTVIGILLLMVTASAAFPTLFSGYFNINLAHFIKKPYTIFNPDAYTIAFNQQTGFVSTIDTIKLHSLMTANVLQLNTIYSLPQTLMRYAKTPTIEMNGSLPGTVQHPLQLHALLNNSIIATVHLVPGKFHWKIPLTPAMLSKIKNTKMLQIQFKTDSHKTLSLSINELILTGFLQAPQTLNVKTVQPFCQQQKTTTVCKINAPKETQLIELPILYYPKLLRITLNGKTIPYQGVVYKNNLIAGIQPAAGKTNVITIQFIGLIWANYVSLLSWIVWIGLLLLCLSRAGGNPFSKCLHTKKKNNEN